MKKTVYAILLPLILLTQNSYAENDSQIEQELAAWDEDESSEASPWNWGGFAELDGGRFIHKNTPNPHLASLSEARFELWANRYLGEHFFSFKGDLVGDAIGERKLKGDLVEMFADLKLSENMNLRLGKQVLTWGTGDYIFINDLFSKNWKAMFSGRDDGYLKKSDYAAKLSVFTDYVNMDLAFIPIFKGDTSIDGEYFSYFNPLVKGGSVTHQRLSIEDPANTLKNSALALRLSKNYRGVEYALYGYHGLYSQPAGFNPEKMKNIYPKMNATGASVRNQLLGGIANVEVAYWHFLDNDYGRNAFMPADQFKLLVGYDHELIPNLTASTQLLLERTLHYQTVKKAKVNYGLKMRDKWHKTLTLRLTYLALQQKLTLSVFNFYSPDSKDFYVRPKVSYRYNDNMFYEIGANIFGGKHQYTQWGQFKDSSNIYMRFKYNF